MIWSKSLLVSVMFMLSILFIGSIIYINYVGALEVSDSNKFIIEEISAKPKKYENSDPIIYETKANTESEQTQQTIDNDETVDNTHNNNDNNNNNQQNNDDNDIILEDPECTTFTDDQTKVKREDLVNCLTKSVELDDVTVLKLDNGKPPIEPNELALQVRIPTIKCSDDIVKKIPVKLNLDRQISKDIGSVKKLNVEPTDLDHGGKVTYHIVEGESVELELEQKIFISN